MSEHVPKLRMPVGDRDHVQGPPGAKITLLEFGDYQCPYCGEAYGIVKRVQAKYQEDLRFVFRNFPLTEIHPRAEVSAEIAEAAAAQGKFWEMHDFIYEHQPHLSDVNFFLQYAEKNLGLDAKRMGEEISTHHYLPRIREDFSTGVRSGVNGTPTFFINDLRHNGDYQFETFVAAIDRILKKPVLKPLSKSKSSKKVRAK
jgi:protein-disulfide isomerase